MICSSVGSSRFAFTSVWCSWTTHASVAAAIINEWFRYSELTAAVYNRSREAWTSNVLQLLNKWNGHMICKLGRNVAT